MRLRERVAIVTGGGRGIGKAIALSLARDGASVAVAGRHEEALRGTAKEIEALDGCSPSSPSPGQSLSSRLPGRSLVLVVDIAQETQVEAAVERTLERFGRIDILVNNAGIVGPTAPAINIDRAQWDEVMAVNLTGAFLCSKAVLPNMIARGSGKIINISSIAGKLAYPLRSPYAASKWGMIGLTRTLAAEVGQHNIQVNAVCPGPVAGERMQSVIEQRAREMGRPPEEVERLFVETTALKRMVEATDVASMVNFLASGEADNITGQAIDVTAGYAL
jgi:NAD(P)-dependent dehydrogenase (short-subunit alcohol dehydrogenase family)